MFINVICGGLLFVYHRDKIKHIIRNRVEDGYYVYIYLDGEQEPNEMILNQDEWNHLFAQLGGPSFTHVDVTK